MTDILNQIDAVLADVTSCQCGCGMPITAHGPSPWFANENCQANWMRLPYVLKSRSEEESVAPEPAPLLTLDDVASSTFVIRRRTPESRRVYLAEQRARHVEMGAPAAWLEAFDALAEAAAAAESAPVEAAGPVAVLDEAFGPGIVMDADQFDEFMATIDEPDDVTPLGRAAERRHRFTLADMEEASAAVRARRPGRREQQPARHGFSTTHWGGITGWRTICACQQGFGEESWHAHAHEHGVDPHGRHLDGAACPCLTQCEQADPPAPPVDAALEPAEVECCGHTTPGLLGTRLLFCTEPTGHEGDHRDDAGCSWSEIPRHSDSGRWHIIGTGDQVFESPCDCPKPLPWWRRMFGGTR